MPIDVYAAIQKDFWLPLWTVFVDRLPMKPAASMVTLLNSKGIPTTEGEMAMLSMTAPRIGLSPQQAAYGLKTKLKQLGRSEHIAIKVPKLKDLHELPKPFLAGIKFSTRTNHMICV